MGFDNARRDREPQPKAAVLPCGAAVGLTKLVEDERQEVWRDPDAAVPHLQHHLAVVAPRTDRDAAASARELDGIVDEVCEQLTQSRGIAEHFECRVLDDDVHMNRLGRRTRTRVIWW